MKKSLSVAALVFAMMIAAVATSHAAAPRKINYQGYLTNPAGAPLTGTYPMVFSLCDAATAGTCPWTETQSVAIDKGIFNVSLGAVTPLALPFDIPYFLDIQVNGEQMSARQPLTSVGYAFQADTATTATTATNFSGSLSGDVTGSQGATVVSSVGGQTAASVAAGAALANNATSVDYVNTLVKRDSAGGFRSGSQTVYVSNGANTGLKIQGTSGQTANLQEWRDVYGTLLGSVTPSGTFAINTGNTPRASLEVGGNDGLLVTGTQNWGTVSALGAGTRMHWYPKKGAFRAGAAETTWWDDANIGLYSVGMGYRPRATAVSSTAIGINNRATGDYSLALGSYSQATASFSTAIGTQAMATGIYSIAIGSGANTYGRDGSVVIGDDAYFQTAYATNDNQITMRFIGGKGGSCGDDNIMNDGGPGTCKAYRFLTYYPDTTYGVYMNGGSSGWVNYSSRTLKENFRILDGEELLGKIRTMSITEWNYKGTPETKYIGPVAEEFYDAFHLNGDDKTGINTISIDGVNMAGVQALEKRTSDMKAEMAEMKATIELLKAELAALKAQAAGK